MEIPDTVKELIKNSGNNFHAKVARWFSGAGWRIKISPYYMDQNQSKAREIDLIAEKKWPIRGNFDELFGTLVVRLFVECKFIREESVFWMEKRNQGAAKNLITSCDPFDDDERYYSRHHYLSEAKVAKLFSSKGASEPDKEIFYKALNQALNSMISLKGGKINHCLKGEYGQVFVLNFPVVVCNSFDKMYAIDFMENSDAEKINNIFQIEVDYAYHDFSGSQNTGYFLLDLVEFEQLERFQGMIENDVNAALEAYESRRRWGEINRT
jgi:hypothetical protein